jgi:hypothetical protein
MPTRDPGWPTATELAIREAAPFLIDCPVCDVQWTIETEPDDDAVPDDHRPRYCPGCGTMVRYT